MNRQSYIHNGMMEAYVLGLMTPEENIGFGKLLAEQPELQQELAVLQQKIENKAAAQAVPPPPGIQEQLYDFMKSLPVLREGDPEPPPLTDGSNKARQYIAAYEVASTHIRVHKYWRIAFLVVFILSKIFLGLLIYYIIKFHEAKTEVNQLQQKQQVQRSAVPR